MDDRAAVALASLKARLNQSALDQSDPLALKNSWLVLTGQNRSNYRGWPPAAVEDFVVVISPGFAASESPDFAGYVADL